MNGRLVCSMIVAGMMLVLGALTARATSMPSTGLRLWLKADAITGLNDGDVVNTWTDSGPSGTTFTKGEPTGPVWKTNIVNGKPAVRFDGITNYLASATFNPGGDDLTMFIVVRTNGVNSGGYNNIFIGGVSSYGATGSLNFWQLYVDAANALQANFLSPATLKINTGVKLSSTSFQVLGLSKVNAAPGSSEVFIDGGSVGTGTGQLTLATSGKCYIGSWNKNDVNGDIAEIVMYNVSLSVADRQLVEGLLAWKYGLQGSLPSGHTWKNVDPTLVPTIANGGASLVSSTGATLSGTLSSGEYPMTVSVYWGTSDAGHPTNGLWEHTTSFEWTSGASPSTNVALPTPNVPYYYWFAASNSAGVSYAPASSSFYASDAITWIQAAAGTHYWTNAANWSPAVVPNTAGVIAVITNERAGAQTVNVGQAITLGQLVVGGVSNVTITKLTGGAFVFNNGVVNPRITCTNVTLSTDVPVTSASGMLEFTNSSTVAWSGILGGFTNLYKTGAGNLSLGNGNSFSGDVTIAGGVIDNGSGTPASHVIPDNAVVIVTNNGIFKQTRSETIRGARGIGRITNTGGASNGRTTIGTNTTGSTGLGYIYLVEGGFLEPGFGATIGDMSTGDSSAVNNQVYIKGGDIYIDIASASSFDRIVLGRSAGTIIDGGNLHLNFLGEYAPTNGTTWDIMTRLNTGGITDSNGGNLFDRIDSNLGGFGFTAEITATPSVRITALRQGTLIILR